MRLLTYVLTLGIGYLVGILWAPRRGASLREEILAHFLEIKEEGEEIARDAIDKSKDIRSIAEGGISKANESLQQAKGVAVEKGKEIKTIAGDSLNKASGSFNQAKDGAFEKGKEIKSIAEDGFQKASDSLNQAKEAALDTVSQLNKNLHDVAADSKKVLSENRNKTDHNNN